MLNKEKLRTTKNNLSFFTMILIITLALSSCQKALNTIIELDVPHTPMLTVNCFNSAITDSLMLNLKGSKGLSDTGICPVITNAAVTLLEDNSPVSTFNYIPSLEQYYANFNNFIGGKTYTVKVSANGYEDVEGRDIMPMPLNNLTMSIVHNAKKLNLEQSEAIWYDEITLTFNDDGSRKDYYSFDVSRSDTNFKDFNEYFMYYGNSKYSLDPDLDGEESYDPLSPQTGLYYMKFYMQDAGFNGKQKRFVFYAPTYSTEPLANPEPWYVMIEHLSENAYRYEKTRKLYDDSDGNPFAEPVQVHNNISKGIGSFRLKYAILDSL